MIINHNLAAVKVLISLQRHDKNAARSMQKLSSGLRINRAADDAAGLAIADKMHSRILGLDQAKRNTQDGISLMQTAEGAMSETTDILQRVRVLAVKSATDAITDIDRVGIQQEVDELLEEVDRIAGTTQYNTMNLLDGSLSKAAAATTSEKRRQGPAIIHIGPDTGQNMKITINSMNAAALGVGGLQVSSREDAAAALSVLDTALQRVSTERGKVGAKENRLEHTSNCIAVETENLMAAESRIRDVDMAKEMMNYAKSNLLSQAATAMLFRVYHESRTVLQLLR